MSAAVLGSQVTANPDEIIWPDVFANNNEGNNEGGSFVGGRLVQLRRNATGVATAVVNAAGSSYAVDDTITLTGGTAARQSVLIVTAVSAGAITGIKVHAAGDPTSPAVTVGADRGEYSVEPSNPVSQGSTSGSGTSATFDLTFKSVEEEGVIEHLTNLLASIPEDWVDGPAQNQNWRISYSTFDVATVTGFTQNTNTDFTATRRVRLTGSGYYNLIGNININTHSHDDPVEAAWHVENGGRMQVGQIVNGVPFDGGVFTSITAFLDMAFAVDDDADKVTLYDFRHVSASGSAIQLHGPMLIKGATFVGSEPLDISFASETQDIFITDIIVSHNNFSEFDFIELTGKASLIGLISVRALGVLSFIDKGRNIIRNYQALNQHTGVLGPGSTDSGFSHHTIVNPVWTVDTSNQIDVGFRSGDAISGGQTEDTRSVIIEAYETLVILQDGTGSPIVNAACHIIEEDVESGIVAGTSNDLNPQGTDANGEFADDTYATIYRDNLTAVTFTDGTNGITFTATAGRSGQIDRLDGGSFITDGFAVGNHIRVSRTDGVVTNNGTYEIVGVTAGQLDCNDPFRDLDTNNTADLTAVVTEVGVTAETRGNFSFRVYKYGKAPFIRGQTALTANLSLPVTMLDDDDITEGTEATALSNGSGIVVERHPAPPRGPFNVQSLAEAASSTTIDLTSFAIPASLNDAILVVVAAGDGSSNFPTGVDFGVGVDALTEAVDVGNSGRGLGIWYLINPANATRTIRATFGSAATDRRIQAFYITNAAQSTPIDQTAEKGTFNFQSDDLDITTVVAETLAIMAYSDVASVHDQYQALTADLAPIGTVIESASATSILKSWYKVLPGAGAENFWITWPYQDGTARTAGTAAVVNFKPSGDTAPVKVFNYDTGTGGDPTVGETITVTNSGADTTGVLVERLGDNTSGTLVLSSWNGVDPDDNAAITGSSSTFAADSHVTGGGSFSEEYTWMIDCSSKALTVVYDYVSAQLAQLGASLLTEFRDLIIWGEDEHALPLLLGSGGWSTLRNVNRAEGVWLANRGAGLVAGLESDGGVTFVPPVSVTVTFTGLKDNSEVRVFAANTADELAGIENATAGSPDDRTFAFTLDATTIVDYKIHNWLAGAPVYETIEVTDFVIPNTDVSIGVQQRLDRNAV